MYLMCADSVIRMSTRTDKVNGIFCCDWLLERARRTKSGAVVGCPSEQNELNPLLSLATQNHSKSFPHQKYQNLQELFCTSLISIRAHCERNSALHPN